MPRTTRASVSPGGVMKVGRWSGASGSFTQLSIRKCGDCSKSKAEFYQGWSAAVADDPLLSGLNQDHKIHQSTQTKSSVGPWITRRRQVRALNPSNLRLESLVRWLAP